ncbi:MAG: ribonuclease T [Gammaproteobacteria bacterium]|nr:ribonuclease T [Gammaproteobacteria bacterium]
MTNKIFEVEEPAECIQTKRLILNNMKKIVLCFFVILTIGCTPDSDEGIDEYLKKDLSLQTEQDSCVVKNEWLNLEYDYVVGGKNEGITTDFFLLVYSNSPNFCQFKKRKGELDEVPFQCLTPNQFGWVIHGLWSESEQAYIKGENDKHPQFCQGDLEKLSLDILKPYLCMSPGTSLLQGEWEKHGACDFDSAKQYFDKTEELYKRFKVPPVTLNAKKAVRWMKDNHSELKDKWLHQTSHEFGICFTTDFEVMSCPRRKRSYK